MAFDTADTIGQVEDFYERALVASGWAYGEGNSDYTYVAASGRSYAALFYHKAAAGRGLHVVIKLKRAR